MLGLNLYAFKRQSLYFFRCFLPFYSLSTFAVLKKMTQLLFLFKIVLYEVLHVTLLLNVSCMSTPDTGGVP